MNLQQGRPFANGYNRRRVDSVMGARMDSKMQPKKSTTNFGSGNDMKAGKFTTPSRDRLIYIFSRLVGHHVEVFMKNGSVISGIFHATNADRDFEIVLKMAQVVKDGSAREKSFYDTIKKPQAMIIPARELVQVLAKDMTLSSDGLISGLASEKWKDLMIDSAISHSHHVEMERELLPWMPEGDDPECPALENTFGQTLNRNWDQFETNAVLFGVKSTFNEEIYTTKLERGPQMRELERIALRIAREIEGEVTHDLHQAEERGIYSHDDLGSDEETRYSAVCREVKDNRFEGENNSDAEANNSETFSESIVFVTSRSCSDNSSKKFVNEGHILCSETQTSSTTSSVDEETCLCGLPDKDLGLSSIDYSNELTSDSIIQNSQTFDDDIRFEVNHIKDQGVRSKDEAVQESQVSDDIILSRKLEELPTSTSSYDPLSPCQENVPSQSSDSPTLSKLPVGGERIESSTRQGNETSSTSEHAGAGLVLTHPSLSPSSSSGSLCVEKSTLNPNAKEFKLNPNAKSFTPSTSMRLHTAATDGSFYHPNNTAPHIHAPPVGSGVGSAFGHQPFFFNQAPPVPSSQAYIPPNGQMYGQQMIVGQPLQFYYMPNYPPELPQRGRKF